MEKLKRSLSIRKKKQPRLESSKPHQWQEDERKVRDGTCSFQVKYLGCVEVYESRGIQICEEAVKVLKAKKSRSAWSRLSFRKKKDDAQQYKSGHHRAILYVTGDALRVVDEISKGLIVDQTIEKVSFCAPDRNHEKGFAYICRDGTTRRWMCHGFFAIKESGERLSHAVGCAFAICLEKKQQREKEKVSVTYNDNGTSFTRMGSFRQTTLTEKLADPQSAIVAEPVPFKVTDLPYAVQRPHAPPDILDRQGSFRGFNKLAESSPFKRNTSLRVNELPSTIDRQKQFGIDGPQLTNGFSGTKAPVISTIIEDEELPPSMLEEANGGSQWPAVVDNFAAIRLENEPPKHTTTFVLPPPPPTQPLPAAQSLLNTPIQNNAFSRTESSQLRGVQVGGSQGMQSNVQLGVVVKQTNPWVTPTQSSDINKVSDAESWLNSTANHIDPFAGVPTGPVGGLRLRTTSNGGQAVTFSQAASYQMTTSPTAANAAPVVQSYPLMPQPVGHIQRTTYPAGGVNSASFIATQQTHVVDPRFQPAVVPSWPAGATANTTLVSSSSSGTNPVVSAASPVADPFDSAWATRAAGKNVNPFQAVPAGGGATFQVKI